MKANDYSKVKTTTLISIVVYGANKFGLKLSNHLAEQGSKVIVIDRFDSKTKEFVQQLKRNKSVDFVAFEGMDELYKTLGRFDYLFYLQFTSLQSKPNFTSKDFLEESNRLEKSLKAALKHKAKASVVTSLQVNKKLIELTQLQSGKPKPYSDLETQRYSETVTAEHYDKSKLNVRIVRMSALMGKGFHAVGDPELEQILEESVHSDKITIKGEGLNNHYIIHVDDAVYGLLTLTFNNQTSGEVITLSNPSPLTTLSAAYKLLELDTEASRIQFVPGDENVLYYSQYSPAPNATNYSWKPKFTLEQLFVDTLKSVYESGNKTWAVLKQKTKKPKRTTTEKPVVETVKTPLGRFLDKLFSPFTFLLNRGKNLATGGRSLFSIRNSALFITLLVVFLLLSFFLFTPLVSIGYGGYTAYNSAKSAYQNATAFKLSESSQQFDQVNRGIEHVKTGTSRLEWLFIISGQREFHEDLMNLVIGAQYASSGAKDMTEALDPLAQYFEQFQPALSFGSDNPTVTTEYRTHLEQLRSNRFQLSKAADSLNLATAQIEAIDTENFPRRFRSHILELKENNRLLAEMITPFRETVYFLPELLGVDDRQRYLILMQNPAEIRSTGGWLSSYALVGIEGGQIRQLEVSDIYDLEGLLTIQGKEYDAPESMQNAFGLEKWSMSLSNWNPDFPTASQDATFFIKEAGKAFEIDGVLAFDTELIKMLLEQWGSIEVEGEVEPITPDNLQTRILQIHSEFQPGAQLKSEFIANLANASIRKLIAEKENYSSVASVLYEALEQKHLLVHLTDSDANKFFSAQQWDGKVDEKYTNAPIAVEWNWGANKANLFLEETTEVIVRFLNENQAVYTYRLSAKNNSTVNSYPEGDYVNWHRVFMPEHATILTNEGYEGPVQIYLDAGLKSVGGEFIVPISGSNRLEVVYQVERVGGEPFPLQEIDGKLVLDLDIYKQPGLYPGTYKLSVEYPDSWIITDTADMNRSVNSLTTQFTHDRDASFRLVWEYK